MTSANGTPLVTTDWLADHLEDPRVHVIEVDEDASAYHDGHIPGAVGWDWSTDLHHPVRRDYLDQEGFSALLSAAGVTDDDLVVVYGGNNNWFAAYAYWLLSYRGFDAIALLDGGRSKWEAEGRPMTTDVPDVTPSGFRIRGAERPQLRVFRDDVLASLDGATFVDVRSPEEFSGQTLAPPHLPQEQPYVGGHVPGALNIPWSRAVAEDATFRPVDELRTLYLDSGIEPSEPVIAYCRIGERSSHTWFVLHELLAIDDVRNYDGSWTEYGSLVGVPVERE